MDKELRDSSCSNDGLYVFRKYRTSSLNFKQNYAHAPEIDPDAERGKTSFPGNKRGGGKRGDGEGSKAKDLLDKYGTKHSRRKEGWPEMFP
jgi:hypothetical protein